MIDVHLPTTDGREIRLTRYTHPEPELQLLIDRLKLCQDVGIDRVVFSLPAEKEDKIMPILDRWSELMRQLG